MQSKGLVDIHCNDRHSTTMQSQDQKTSFRETSRCKIGCLSFFAAMEWSLQILVVEWRCAFKQMLTLGWQWMLDFFSSSEGL